MDELNIDSAFLGAISSQQRDSPWLAKITIGDTKASFKLDTGAEITAISNETYESCGKPQLQKSIQNVYGPARQKLHVIGQVKVKLTYKGVSSEQTICVIRGLKVNLLGLPAIKALNILQRLDAIGVEKSEIQEQYPKLFKGLGTLGEEYKIELREGATPYCLYTPRNVAMPLRPKVKEQLNKMEAMGVISKVSKPTEWCAGMVVVPKVSSGEVRICVDLTHLNDNVLREVHPIPTVDETLAQLAGAKVFSKLDANSGFWQIPLAPESYHLTTFVTPFGRYQFEKLPLGSQVHRNCSRNA